MKSLRSRHLLVAIPALVLIQTVPAAEQVDEARAVADRFLVLVDQGDAATLWPQVGEQWKRLMSRGEFAAAMQRWTEAKGGKAIERTLVLQKTMTEQEAKAFAPNHTAKGSIFAFRFRSKYPSGTFFEDLYVNRDSDSVMRVAGHHPQVAE